MPTNPRTHVWIPANRVRVEPAGVGRGGEKWSREDYSEHSARLLHSFQASIARFSNKHDLDLATDLVVAITTNESRSISAERTHLRNIGFEVISFDPDSPNKAIGRISRENLPKLTKRLETYAGTPKHRGKGNLGAIESIAPVAVENKIHVPPAHDGDPPGPCLISVYASLPPNIKEQLASRIVRRLHSIGKLDTTTYYFANGDVGVSTELTTREMTELGEQFMLIRSIESNSLFMEEHGIQAEEVPQVLQVERVRCNTPVVIVDSGINGTSPLFGGLIRRVVSALPPGCTGPHLEHGTFVASRAVYGDDISTVLTRRVNPWCPVIDLQVTGRDAGGNRVYPSPAELGSILEREVSALANESRVFNLSLGAEPVRTGFYSMLAKILDFLSRTHKVLFVISAGNINDPVAPPPGHYLTDSSRVLSPAEGLLVLSVGSIAKKHEVGCVAQLQEIAPYSRRGPGADEGLKPELAAHGGNVFFNGNGWASSPGSAVYGLNGAGTHLEYSVGTSFAAPIVAQYAARLFDAYPEGTPNLVKALLCHFASPVKAPTPGQPVEEHHFCGFGEPEIDRTLFTATNSMTYLFQGALAPDCYTYIPFHVPQELVDDDKSRLTIRGTVIFDPPVNPDDAARYSLCRVVGQLRKRKGDDLRGVAIGGEEDDVRFPWNPVMYFSHDFNKGYGAGEWELRLRLMTRGDVAQDFTQTVAVVLEVTDRSGRTDVRETTLARYPGIYLPVELRIAA